jgi:hypothetical protein
VYAKLVEMFLQGAADFQQYAAALDIEPGRTGGNIRMESSFVRMKVPNVRMKLSFSRLPVANVKCNR